ncbi:AI-2E family transporter [Butyrivibrio sp. AE3009]|uniref:AI-2E family transporter n=1 Tax=Butyrivibrio sp. AE3009 TaxID=1280666 RepID=UPI0018CAC2ED|nr:AI-2E family transporter [Butyrivibrio sp. AE3009]
MAVCIMLAYSFIFENKDMMTSLGKIANSLSGIIFGLVMAYVLIPLLEGIEEKILIPIYRKRGIKVSIYGSEDKKKRKQIRTISVVLTMGIFILIVYGLFRIIIPQLISSIREIVYNLPVYIKNIDEYSNLLLENNPDLQRIIDSQLDAYYANLSSFLSKKLMPLLPNVNTIVKVASKSFFSVLGVFIDIIVGFIVAIYVLNAKERFATMGKKMAYAFLKEEYANELIGGFRFVNNTFAGFVGGKLIDSLIIGIICYFGCRILGISYPVLISVIVGVTNIIPFFGPYIGGAAGALLLVLIDPIKALVFLIFVIVLQQFDGNILGPLILGNSTGLSSFWVIFAITLFGGLWGIIGLFVGVPVFAVFYALVARITNMYLTKRNLSTETTDYDDLAYIENGEFKSLGDSENTKYNAGKEPDTFERIFKMKGKKRKSQTNKTEGK